MPEQSPPSPEPDPQRPPSSRLIPSPRTADPAETPPLLPDRFETSIADDEEEDPGSVRIDVPDGYVTGVWQDPGSPPGVAKLGNLYVTDEGKGKGAYLVGVFAREAIAHGATMLHAGIVSVQAMRNRRRIFGEHNLIFVERRPDGSEWVLPMTSDQAMMSIRRAEEAADRWDEAGEDWPNDFDPAVETRVNLMSPSVRAHIGLPPVADGIEPPRLRPGKIEGGGEAVFTSGESVGGVRAGVAGSVEIVRAVADSVLGSSATLRNALVQLQEALRASASDEVIIRIQQALDHAGISVEGLNAAIEQLRRYDREIGQ